jgi:hypothetical protein
VLFGVFRRREREMCGQNGKKDMKKKTKKEKPSCRVACKKKKKRLF